FATLIRKDLDAKAKSAANKEIEGTKNLGEEKLKEAEQSAQAEYEAHKAELLAGTGLEQEAAYSDEKLAAANVERRMLELQQSQAYRQVTAKGFGIR
ncbi:MAG: hypothetical protein KDB07_06120, partial [Planctomycetes bacterium]|nr:hypothetical protein [Planctomycetota bacterium]